MVKFNLRRLTFYITIITIFVLSINYATYGETIKTDEIITKKGKIITGLTKEEAVKKFGLPNQAAEKFWYYHKPEKFWVYFQAPTKLISISILPRYVETTLEQPAMFKAVGKFSDLSSEDISDQVEWLSEDEQIAKFVDYGIIMPRSVGTTQVLAFKADIISPAVELNVSKGKELPEKQKIELVSVDVIPHNPRVSFRRNKLIFKALGTFKNNQTNEYFIKDISDDVVWHSKDKVVAVFVDNVAYLGSLPGKAEIFCSKDEIVSPAQVLKVSDMPAVIQDVNLESITVLPRTVIIKKKEKAKFMAFATFNDANVKEITLDVDWKVKDYEIARVIDKGKLATKIPGITEVQAVMDEISSEPRKLVVLEVSKEEKDALVKEHRLKKVVPIKKSEPKEPFSPVERKKIKKPSAPIDEVEKQIKSLKEQMASSLGRKLRFIQVTPSNPEVPLGDNLQFRAKGEYTDGSYKDLTSQVKWQSSNHNVATIGKNGIAQSKSIGVSLITASLDKIESSSQRLTVIAPQLVSIGIIPENPTVPINQTIQFEAQGNYTDESTRDVTAEVDWVNYDQNIAKFSHRGKLNPRKVGRVEVFARYELIESPRQLVTVIAVSVAGVLRMFLWRLLGLFLFAGPIFLIIMYLRHHMFIQRLKKLMYGNPRSFVIRLYNNLLGVLALYGTVRKKSMPPEEYVRLVKKKYAAEDIDKLAIFTERFNEARYSSHPVDQEVAYAAAGEYDVIIACVMKLHRLRSNFIRYFRIILRKLPLKISG